MVWHGVVCCGVAWCSMAREVHGTYQDPYFIAQRARGPMLAALDMGTHIPDASGCGPGFDPRRMSEAQEERLDDVESRRWS